MQRHQDGWSAGRQIRVPCGTHWLDSYKGRKAWMGSGVQLSHTDCLGGQQTLAPAGGHRACCSFAHGTTRMCAEYKLVVHQLVCMQCTPRAKEVVRTKQPRKDRLSRNAPTLHRYTAPAELQQHSEHSLTQRTAP